MGLPKSRSRQNQAAAEEDFAGVAVLFLLPTGRPRFFASAIHAGGRPRRRPRPRARRSRLRIASSSCSLSWRNSSEYFRNVHSQLLYDYFLPLSGVFQIWNGGNRSKQDTAITFYRNTAGYARALFRFRNKGRFYRTGPIAHPRQGGYLALAGTMSAPIKIKRQSH